MPVVLIWLTLIGCWIVNTYQFTQCDFDAPYRCEAIHGVGIIAPVSFVTVWFETDTKGE